MSANATTAAPTGRKKFAPGKEHGGRAQAPALGNDFQNTLSPEGAEVGRWSSVPLSEVVEFNPRFGKDELADDSLASFIPMKCVEEESGRFEPLGDRKVAEVRNGYTPFRDGDVIFAKVTPCMENGKAAVLKGLTNGVGFGSTEFFALRPKNGLEANYLFHFILQSNFRRDAARNMTGAVGLRRVPKSWLEQQAIPLPEPAEQRRIVAEIEKQFTRLEAGVAALRRVQANLKRYRAAVLKAACEARLVPTEAELSKVAAASRRSPAGKQSRDGSATFESGAALLARILTERRQNWQGRGQYKEPATPRTADLPPLPEGWTWATAQQLNVANRPCAYGVLQPGEDIPDGVPFVRVGDINNGKVELANMKRISTTIAAQYPRTKLHGGELAITLVGAIGRTAIIPDNLAGGNTARAVGIIPLTKQVNAHWVEIWFRNPVKNAEMDSKSHEVARKTLNLEDVRIASVALPLLAEQARIVAEVERRLSVVEELESVVSANLQRASRLRQSILQKAFTGQL